MSTALWIVQIVLALVFFGAGVAKLTVDKSRLLHPMPWVTDYSQRGVWAIGGLEVLGAVGLVAPGVTGIAPALTVAAAAGLAVTMVGGFAVHVRRGEYARSTSNVMLFALAVFVVMGRWMVAPL